MRMDFRAEFFNLFNHAQFGLPFGDCGCGVNSMGNQTGQNPLFGTIGSTVGNPRVIQFALKLNF
jgi:hypothetical protein